MKKRLICLLLALALCAAPASALEGEAQRAGDTLAAMGLVQGTPAGYDLEGPCTRAQALVLLSRLGSFPAGGADPYTDTPAWAKAEVSALSGAGMLSGIFSEPSLLGNEYINADEWSALLLRLCGIPAEKSGASLYARRLGLLSREYTSPLTRGEVFEMTCSALSYSYEGATLAQHLGLEAAGDKLLSARTLADHASAAVFTLCCYTSQRSYAKGTARADGTGFFLTSDGIAVTCYHVLENTEVAVATLVTGEQFLVEGVLWADEEADLAVIRVSRSRSDAALTTPAFAALTLAGTEEVYPGDRAYAIGNALGLGLSVSEGLVSGLDRACTISDQPCLTTTASISAGSSGGPLFNELGHVIAVTAGAFVNGNETYIAIPVDELMEMDFTSMELQTLKDIFK